MVAERPKAEPDFQILDDLSRKEKGDFFEVFSLWILNNETFDEKFKSTSATIQKIFTALTQKAEGLPYERSVVIDAFTSYLQTVTNETTERIKALMENGASRKNAR